MKTFKTRHQLFLHEALSRRFGVLAKNSGRARSEILVEALEAWFERREASSPDHAIVARLTRMEQDAARLRHSQDLLWEGVSQLIKHQLTTAASLPPVTDAARAAGAKAHQNFLDLVAERLAAHAPQEAKVTVQ